MKKLISYFIKFPVAVNVLIFAFAIFGYMGMKTMKSSFFPLTDSEVIRIETTYPGASPSEMEEGIVLKIEDNLKGLVGIDRVTSVSRENSASITVETEKGQNIDVILADVKNAVDRVPTFPSGMEPPIIYKVESIRSTISFTLSGQNTSLLQLKKYALDIENDLRGIEGISQVIISGYPDEEIAIHVRSSDLNAYNLSFREVANAVSNNNLLVSGGNIKTSDEEYLIRAQHKNYYAKDLLNIVVRSNAQGGIVRLKDVASVQDAWSENPDRIYYNDQPAINITVNNTNSEDLISTSEKVKDYIDDFNQKHLNLSLNVASDASITLTQRTALLTENAIIGILLVLFFLALFLNVRLAFWVAAGLPIAFFGMFMFAAQLGITINVLSLFGMIIVIGILVDDGIVIGENIFHHYEMGKSPIKAAIDGTIEVIPPVISALLTTMIAFSTFFFLDGRIGNFFSEVATVVTLTLTVSLVEALIILPAHIAHSKALQKADKINPIGRFFRGINSKADQLLVWLRDRLYLPFLTFFLKNKVLGIAIPFSLLIFSFGAIRSGIVSTSFFPRIASDRISVDLKMTQGTHESITDSLISFIETKAWEINDHFTEKQTGQNSVVENIIKRIGPGSANASLTINLLPGEYRDFASSTINQALREAVGVIPEAESLTFGSNSNFGGSPISISLLSNNVKELKSAKKELKQLLSQNPQLKDISDNDPEGIKEIRLTLKNTAYSLGLNLNEVMNQVRSGFFGFQAQRFQRGQDEIKIWVRYDKADRASVKQLGDMKILTSSGERVSLSEIATYEIQRGEIAINHLSGRREIQVNADLKSTEDSASDLLELIKQNELKEVLQKHPSIAVSYEGQNRQAAKTIGSVGVVGPIILILIYIIISFTFRTYTQPLILMLMIPFSLIGVVWGHYIHHFHINILSWLGIIALIGIMVNDGLVLIGKFNSFLKDGVKFDEALILAGKSRFRAIFLTSLTTIAGLAPLMLETSRQAQFLIPMAISISYGIAIATVLTLVMLPILIAISNHIKVAVKWLLVGGNISKEEVERAIVESKFESDELH